MNVTMSQYRYLQGFFFACHCHYNAKIRTNFLIWAELLDQAGIPWSIQNTVANLADTKENDQLYLSTLLQNNNIQIKG